MKYFVLVPISINYSSITRDSQMFDKVNVRTTKPPMLEFRFKLAIFNSITFCDQSL